MQPLITRYRHPGTESEFSASKGGQKSKDVLSKVPELADNPNKPSHGHAFEQALGVILPSGAVELRIGQAMLAPHFVPHQRHDYFCFCFSFVFPVQSVSQTVASASSASSALSVVVVVAAATPTLAEESSLAVWTLTALPLDAGKAVAPAALRFVSMGAPEIPPHDYRHCSSLKAFFPLSLPPSVPPSLDFDVDSNELSCKVHRPARLLRITDGRLTSRVVRRHSV